METFKVLFRHGIFLFVHRQLLLEQLIQRWTPRATFYLILLTCMIWFYHYCFYFNYYYYCNFFFFKVVCFCVLCFFCFDCFFLFFFFLFSFFLSTESLVGSLLQIGGMVVRLEFRSIKFLLRRIQPQDQQWRLLQFLIQRLLLHTQPLKLEIIVGGWEPQMEPNVFFFLFFNFILFFKIFN